MKILRFNGECSPKYSRDSLRAHKTAWDCYITAAFYNGFLDNEKCSDLWQRLISKDDANFRGAIAECMVIWFFSGRLRYNVYPDSPTRSGPHVDMRVSTPEGELAVEVKAPLIEQIGDFICGNDSEVLKKRVSDANKQFLEGRRNVLVLVPQLRIPVFQDRYQLIEALLGQEKLVQPLVLSNREDIRKTPIDSKLELPHLSFELNGKFTKSVKKDSSPAFTRISAVISIEEMLRENSDGPYIDHRVLIVHNPNTARPVSTTLFGECVQFCKLMEGWGWSDGHRIGM